MRNKHCINCYYNDLCQCDEACEDYTPVSEQSINQDVGDMVEQNRIDFRAEWFKYIEAWDN